MTVVSPDGRASAAAARLSALLGCALSFSLVACADVASGSGCARAEDCGGSGAICLAGACVPRASERRYYVELRPRAGAGHARTELGPLALAPGATLPVASALRVRLTLSALDPAWTAQGLSEQGTRLTILGVTSIPGQPPPAWAGAALSEVVGQPAGLTLELPAGLLGNPVDVLLQPAAPLDRALPPWRERVLVAPAMGVSLPGNAALTTLEGSVRTALDLPAAGLIARARRDADAVEARVSNLAHSDDQGRYRLVLPRTLTADPEARIEISLAYPSDRAAAELSLPALAAGTPTLPAIRLPAYPNPESVRIPIAGVWPDGRREPVAGALVRMQSEIAREGGHLAWHRVAGESDATGLVQLPLLAGELGNPRRYAMVVVPPPESRFSSRCLGEYVLLSHGSGAPPVITAEVPLAPRVRLLGQLLDPEGRPAPAVAVRAESAEAPDPACPVTPAPAQSVTDPRGRFELWVEPGRTRLHFQPPAGAPLPTWQEELDVRQDLSILRRAPAGAVLDGSVRDPMGRPSVGCEVRLYQAGEPGAGSLLGRAITDAAGAFRVVVSR